MNILLSGITSSFNRGVDALVRTNIELIRQQFPSCNLFILSQDKCDKCEWEDLGVTVIEYQELTFNRLFYKFGLRTSLNEKLCALKLQKKLPQKIDLHIVTGGDLFTSEYGGFKEWVTLIATISHLFHPITYLSAQSIGPFTCPRDKTDFKKILSYVHMLSFREKFSRSYVETAFSHDLKNITITDSVDPAFLLKPSLYNQLIEKQTKEKVVCFVVSNGIAKFKSMEQAPVNAGKLAFIKSLISQNYKVVLMAHVQGETAVTNDVLACNNLFDGLTPEEQKRVIKVTHGNASQLKYIISQCDYVVAERMHAAIAGVSLQKPTIVIGYSQKAKGIMSELFENDLSCVCQDLTGELYNNLAQKEDLFNLPTLSPDFITKYSQKATSGYQMLASIMR